MKVARIAIPRPNVDDTWDYIIPADLTDSALTGKRVLIDVGSSTETGYITEVASEPSTRRTLKPIREILDDEPLLSTELLRFTRWVSEYYICSWGDILKASLPAGINVKETEKLRISPSGKAYLKELRARDLITEEEGAAFRLLDHLRESGPVTGKGIVGDHSGNLVSKLLGSGHIERITARSGRSLEKRILAVRPVTEPPEFPDSFWNRSSKRKDAYERLLLLDRPLPLANIEKELGISRSILQGLVANGLVEKIELVERRNPFKDLDIESAQPHRLTNDQLTVCWPMAEDARDGIFNTYLLHGVTGSGKTEIYLHVIQECLNIGKTALVLIPELALTPQFVRRYYAVFGDELAVMHSGLPLGQRTDEWRRVRDGKANVVLGTRLSVFAPLRNIGLIVVDEEHDQSYRQEDYPQFNARDMAVVRARMNDAVCVLGSATPSLESLHNADTGKYRLLTLERRVFDRPLPTLNVVDLREAEHSRAEGQVLPTTVNEAIQATLDRSEQCIVLVGRKGYAPFVICRACGNSFQCPTCSISMTWHDGIDSLKCHYCGKTRPMPDICPECTSSSIGRLGTGSARVEEYLVKQFPMATVSRMDRDVITRPDEYRTILERLRTGEIDIIVGTQMLAKGHDYPRVTTVVALGLDSILNLPDFRHAERLFQLIIQISGRSGRGEVAGSVYILTYRPGHYAIEAAVNADWQAFLEKELRFRKSLRYPPYGYLALVLVEDYKKSRGFDAAQKIAERLHTVLKGKSYILGPNLAPYARLKNRWRYQIFIKAPDRNLLNGALREIRQTFSKGGNIKIHVDPVSVM